MKIYGKLLKIQQSIDHFTKDKKSFNFTYTTGDQVLNHIRPLMNEYGLILKQEVTALENTRIDYTTKNGSKSEILTKVMMIFTWVDTDTGEMDVNQFGANGMNDWDKGLGSALTYAERYFLLKYFHVPTDSDDIDNDKRKQPYKKPAPKTTPKPEPKKDPQKKPAPKKTSLPLTSVQIRTKIKAMTQEHIDAILKTYNKFVPEELTDKDLKEVSTKMKWSQ